MAGIKAPRHFLTYRVDANQPSIVKTLRQLGFLVHHTHSAGAGFPDLLITKHGINILAEIKDGSKTPSARDLNPKQREFFRSWSGSKCVLTCDDDCLSLNTQVNAIAAVMASNAISLTVYGSKDPIYLPFN